MSPSRRTVLRASAAGAVAAAGVTALERTFAAARPDAGVSVYAFPLSAVTLLAGPYPADPGWWLDLRPARRATSRPRRPRVDGAATWCRPPAGSGGSGGTPAPRRAGARCRR
ncbi:hypothetical protein GCM10023170_024800 [Phytohabitans houttuyneae]|uniref:Uncharacterized protein n=1 Tax=Phytohabitans houttuyneae TaxID=1076126 RepID=A0A6V8KLY6_9ACTN|nr:hypothetical protein Phou_071360 [Phytohabitans houttuyneae]